MIDYTATLDCFRGEANIPTPFLKIPVKKLLFSLISNAHKRDIRIYEIEQTNANVLQEIETTLGLARNTLIRKIPVFEQGFLPTVLVYTDKDLADADNDIICTRVVSRQNSGTGDIILDLVSMSQLSSKTTVATTAATNRKESLVDSSATIKTIRIELPFGKKLHARD